MKFPKLKDGDVFKVPLGDGRAAVGQVISTYFSAHYVVIFDFVAQEDDIELNVTSALQSRPAFGGLTFDALFRPGRWQVLGNSVVDGRKFLPAYKTGASEIGNCVIEDFKGTRRRPATEVEEAIVPFRTTISPIILERAMKAHVGMEPWLDAFDEVRLGQTVKSADIFDD
ncbi:immunity 26/phosphotriesterase HocA family protein [Arthrobacter zhangbolii]|uniref:Immunity 26/phosphotriesterase HocA family protein n=1 Tax=Arthrobacter zhangbolii TaxID=2886936 RepID=A0A9X1M6E7_9MICC|nr:MULTISPECIES: Imm26 family immunity protein [Arthrobacter]MCC3271715.1 immunity 26/phosphotriesterase HocA family protein [Arthrobacter zhangbolii]MCC3293618.1 immunity 26/phosphotriesterase HocA family protein [Arthrobacter zhangbolii]MDN3904786.1 Imm26 family immunity protein [Arthrobacter sp. YD2]UON93457.1 immunity 26/phosphotriesterase HocA family protein [Arthrobacter zhangbolii]